MHIGKNHRTGLLLAGATALVSGLAVFVNGYGVRAWGDVADASAKVVVVADGDGGCLEVVKLDSGSSHVCALLSNKELWCWGSRTHGQLGEADRELLGLVAHGADDQQRCTVAKFE